MAAELPQATLSSSGTTDSRRAADAAVTREALAGAGLGLLVGLLVGLSAVPVVGPLVSGLVAALAAFFGLAQSSPPAADGQATAATQAASGRAWRIAAFGLVCSGAVVVGVLLRSRNIMGEPPAVRVKAWTNAGYRPDVARSFVAYEMLGIADSTWRTVNAERTAASIRSSLFSSGPAQCSELREPSYATSTERLQAYRLAGGDWGLIASVASGFSPDIQAAILQAGWKNICGQ